MLLLMTLCIIYPSHFEEESAILHVSITNSQQRKRSTDNYPDFELPYDVVIPTAEPHLSPLSPVSLTMMEAPHGSNDPVHGNVTVLIKGTNVQGSI